MSKKNKKKNKEFNNNNSNNLNNNQLNKQNNNNNKNNNNNNFAKQEKIENNKNDMNQSFIKPVNNNDNNPKEEKSIFDESNNKNNIEISFEKKIDLEENAPSDKKSIFEESFNNEEIKSEFEEHIDNEENNKDEKNTIFEETISIEETPQYNTNYNFEEPAIIKVDQNEKEFDSIEVTNNDNENEKNSIDLIINKKEPKHYYFGYYTRLTVLVLSLVLSFGLAIVFALNIFDISKEDYLNYSEKSNIDYKVYLKENNFYDTDYLLKDRVYVASLIDKINMDFNYNFTSDKNIDAIFKYNINAKLLITDINNENIYYEKEYVLLPEKEISLKDNKTKTIIETINVNYDQYNKIANSFKNNYALNTKNKLIIYFNVDKNFMNNGNIFNNDKNKMSLEIPLSEKSVEIKLDTNEINNNNKLLLSTKNEYKINVYFIVLFVLAIIVFILVLLKTIKYVKCLVNSDNCYDSYINKLLNEYDRLIVKTNTSPFKNKDDKENIINVENFEELLDVRDNVKKPIMYYVITKHVKCQFYIRNEGNIYITTIKRVDLEAKNENM